ncbi:MAG: suppressor of fused domain protein [Micrococcales bacterium]|nr:suppressor of fused domain protein [Micrococcales bacterium]
MDTDSGQPPVDDDTTPGWDAITAHFEAVYPDQKSPVHYGTIIKYSLGGPDPIDGVSVYRAAEPVPHWHYVTYGYSDLYGQNKATGDEDSDYGIEMTFRLADPAALDPARNPPVWVVNLLQNLARYVFETGNVIYAGHHMNANGPIALEEDTLLTALAFTDDPIGTPIRTPTGLVRLVQAVGITSEELDHAIAWNCERVLDTIGQRWPRGLTVLDRPGLDEFSDLLVQVEEGVERDGSSVGYLGVQTLLVSGTPDDLTVRCVALPTISKTVKSRLPYRKSLLVVGDEEVLELVPEDGPPVRQLAHDDEPARISLTDAGVAALQTIPAEPGEYRLPDIPGVRWELVATQDELTS